MKNSDIYVYIHIHIVNKSVYNIVNKSLMNFLLAYFVYL